MSTQALGKKGDSLFRKTATKKPELKARKLHREIFTLFNDHVEFLNDFTYKVHKETGYKLKKSQVVRALVDLIKDSPKIDIKKIQSNQDLLEQIKKSMKV